jgi:ankyrin repeat protein
LPALQIQVILEQTSRSEIRQAIRSLPREVNAAFDATLDRIQKQPRNRARLALATLTWISHARRPLQVEELRHALAVTPGDTELEMDSLRPAQFMITCCLGLVTVDQASATVRLVHFSLQEYFQQNSTFPLGEDMLAEICLTYLSFDVFAQGPCETREDMEQRLTSHLFVQYAASNWGHHVRNSSQGRTLQLALEFVSQPMALRSAVQAMDIEPFPISWAFYAKGIPSYSVTGLSLAATFNLNQLAQLLIEKGIKVDAKDCRGRTPLHIACRKGHKEMATLLLESGANAKATDDECGWNALHFAADAGHESVVLLLLDNTDLEVDSVNSTGQTALHWAAYSEHSHIVELLHGRGADVNARNNMGETALHWSALLRHTDMMEQLLKYGASVNSRTDLGHTVLEWAGTCEENVIAQALLKYRID